MGANSRLGAYSNKYGNKETFFRAEINNSLKSFCFEAFEHVLYPNAVTHKTRSGFTDECKSVKSRKLCILAYMFFETGARSPRAEIQ